MSDTQRISNGAEYRESLRGRDLRVHLLGERIEEPVDHPVIRPSINAMAATYDLAVEEPELATAWSPLIGDRVNRFLTSPRAPTTWCRRTGCSAGSASSPAPASSAASAWTPSTRSSR